MAGLTELSSKSVEIGNIADIGTIDCQLKRESSHSAKDSVASKLLKKRLGEVALGKPVGPDIEKTDFEDMAAMITNDYRANGVGR